MNNISQLRIENTEVRVHWSNSIDQEAKSKTWGKRTSTCATGVSRVHIRPGRYTSGGCRNTPPSTSSATGFTWRYALHCTTHETHHHTALCVASCVGTTSNGSGSNRAVRCDDHASNRRRVHHVHLSRGGHIADHVGGANRPRRDHVAHPLGRAAKVVNAAIDGRRGRRIIVAVEVYDPSSIAIVINILHVPTNDE